MHWLEFQDKAKNRDDIFGQFFTCERERRKQFHFVWLSGEDDVLQVVLSVQYLSVEGF